MRLIILTKRNLVTIGFCILAAATALTVGITSTVKTVQTAAEPRKIPIYCVESDKKQVAISFDAAWGDEQTNTLLDILDEYHVTSTFFLVGDWVEKYPDDVKEIAKRGHDIGNHSNTHPHMTELSVEDMKEEISACNDKVKELTGKSPTLFRPPYGDYNNDVVDAVNSLGMYCVQWSADSLDWQDPSPEQLCENVLCKIEDGAIVLLHNGAKNTPAALRSVIEGIQEKGYDIVPISEIIPKGEYYTDAQGKMHLSETTSTEIIKSNE